MGARTFLLWVNQQLTVIGNLFYCNTNWSSTSLSLMTWPSLHNFLMRSNKTILKQLKVGCSLQIVLAIYPAHFICLRFFLWLTPSPQITSMMVRTDNIESVAIAQYNFFFLLFFFSVAGTQLLFLVFRNLVNVSNKVSPQNSILRELTNTFQINLAFQNFEWEWLHLLQCAFDVVLKGGDYCCLWSYCTKNEVFH